LAALAVFAARPATAAIQVTIEPPTFAVEGGSPDDFDVALTNTGTSSVTIGAFAFELSVSSSYLTLTQATTATSMPYIFAGSSALGPVISLSSPSNTLKASDLTTVLAGVSIASGATVGLGHVFFDLSPGAPFATVPVTFVASATNLSDPSNVGIPIDVLGSGTIEIVPEPSMFAIFSIGIGLVGIFQVHRKMRHRGC
jgi:hypothetical protein